MVGVLALQGNFDSHIRILKKINLKHKLVKTSDDLSSIDGLIIPGGESTTITNLLRRNQSLIDGINQLSKNKPISLSNLTEFFNALITAGCAFGYK